MRRDGFAATTIREVGAAAGVSVGSVLAHYGSKEDLLFELFFEQIDALVAGALDAAEQAPGLRARLALLAAELVAGYAADARVSADVLRHALLARGRWGEAFKAQAHSAAVRIAGWYAAAVKQGQVHPELDVEAAVLTYMSAYYFMILDLVKTDFVDTAPAVARLNAILELHWKGIHVEERPTRPQRRRPANSRRVA